MMSLKRSLLATLPFLCFPAMALADEGVFERLDADADGYVTQEEVAKEHQRLFGRLLRKSDRDKDGKLSRDEFTRGTKEKEAPVADTPQPGRRPAGASLLQLITRLDRDNSGGLSQSELPEQMRPFFRRLDANGDGEIDREEAARAQRAREQNTPSRTSRKPPAESPKQPAKPSATPRPPAGSFLYIALMRVLDANGDGELSSAEIEAASAVLRKLDRDRDGAVRPREIFAAGRRP